MLTSLALVFLLGLAAAALCSRIGLPRIIGMLLSGILIGPYVLNWLDDSILSISSELRQMALIIILIKAGLSLNLSDLKKSETGGHDGVRAASCEILAFFLLAPHILGINRIEAASWVPCSVRYLRRWLCENGTADGRKAGNRAGHSADDTGGRVLRRYLCDRAVSTFSTMAQGGSAHLKDFVNIPVSIILGIALGSMAGYLLSLFFETAYAHSHMVRNSMKVIVVMGVAFLLMSIETWLKPVVSVSGLLAVISMACVLKLKCTASVSAAFPEIRETMAGC